jgi:hypothetical protein
MAAQESASFIQSLGAFGFGALMGWYVYYVNRYRSGDVKLADLVTLVGVLGGSSILALFPASTDLFGAYGIGLAVGFFGYFLILLRMVKMSPNFDGDWFLDGRRKAPGEGYVIPEGTRTTAAGMGRDLGKDGDNSPIG